MLKRLHSHVQRAFQVRYAQTYAKARHLFILDSVLVLSAVILAGISLFFSFVPRSRFEPLVLNIRIGEPRIISGQTTTLLVSYYNQTRQPLDHVSLQVYFPKEFLQPSFAPFATSTFARQIIDLGTLPPGAQATIPFMGIAWSEPGNQPKFFATIHSVYKEKNYEQAETYLAHIAGSVLRTQLVTPNATASVGQIIPFTYTLQNTGNIPLTTRLRYTGIPLLNDFSIQTLPFQLQAGEQKIVTGSVQLTDNNESQSFALTADVVLPTGFAPLATQTTTLRAAEPPFVSRLTIPSGQTGTQPNQPLALKVEWKNNSKTLFQQARIQLTSNPALKTAGPSISLGNVAPGTAGSSTFEINLSQELSTATSSVTLTPLFQALSNTVPVSLPGESLSLPLAPVLSLDAEVRYFTPEGDQLGRGPLPPRVGETTKYWLIVTAQPHAGSLSEPLLSLQLAPQVSFTGKYHNDVPGTFLFSTTSATAQWQGTTSLVTTTRWYVEVALTPLAREAGTVPRLLTQGVLTGKDQTTRQLYTFPLLPRTNALSPNDRGAPLGAQIAP